MSTNKLGFLANVTVIDGRPVPYQVSKVLFADVDENSNIVGISGSGGSGISGSYVINVNSISGSVNLVAGPNISISASGNFITISAESLSGGSAYYVNPLPTTTQVGGISVGTTFPSSAGKTIQQVLDMMLYPYQNPTFNSFSIQGQTNPLEVGDSILANRTFLWGTTNSANISANSISIYDQTNSNTLISGGLSNDGSESTIYSSILKTSQDSHIFRIEALNTNGVLFSSTYTVNWRWRVYFGNSILSGPLAESDIESLSSSQLSNTFVGNYNFSPGGYKYICYPTSFGTATTFKDSDTNLSVAMDAPYTVSITNSFGQTTSYRVHRTFNVLGSAITIIVS